MSTIEITIHIPEMAKSTTAEKQPRPLRKRQEPAATRTTKVRAAHSHPNVTWEAATTTSLRR
jgi:hypothetical protein